MSEQQANNPLHGITLSILKHTFSLAEDVADVITFLSSEQGHWLTGQLIYASGGFLKFMSE